jgi:hypothetical protein
MSFAQPFTPLRIWTGNAAILEPDTVQSGIVIIIALPFLRSYFDTTSKISISWRFKVTVTAPDTFTDDLFVKLHNFDIISHALVFLNELSSPVFIFCDTFIGGI